MDFSGICCQLFPGFVTGNSEQEVLSCFKEYLQVMFEDKLFYAESQSPESLANLPRGRKKFSFPTRPEKPVTSNTFSRFWRENTSAAGPL